MIVYQIVLALVVIAFFVMAGMSSRTWRALHVTAVFFVFLTGFAFVVLAAASLKTRATWKQQADNLEQQLAEANKIYNEILHGDPDADQQTEVTLEDVRARLTRLSLDRGRVWRQCRPQPFEPGGSSNPGIRPTVVVATDPTDAEPRENRIDQDSILYVFREALSADGYPVPVAYVGEFKVTVAAADQITMEPMHDLENHQVNQMARPGSWALYEMMPLDDHRVHVDPNERIQIEEDNVSIFGTVDETSVREILQFVNVENFPSSDQFPAKPLDAAQLDNLIADRLRDGRRAESGDPNSNVFMKVRFLKSHNVTVDYADVQSSLTSDYFDSSGTAISERLKRGGKVEFKVDQIGIIHVNEAQTLIADGVCELMERIYVRDLIDYDQLYFEIRSQIRELALQEKSIQEVIDRINAAEGRIDEQFAIRQEERVKLESDQANIDKELAVLKGYTDDLASQRRTLYTDLSKLYSTNKQLAAQIAEAHQRIRDDIDAAISEKLGSISTP